MTRKVVVFEILLIAAALAATALAYPHLPSSIPIHWNLRFQPDGYGSPAQLYLLGPGLMSGMMLLTWLLPLLSPKNFQIERFRTTYNQLMLIAFCFFLYLFAAVLWTALGHPLDMGRVIMGGLCLFWFFMGNLMGKVRRNFYSGFRTPWALASERVWNATHRFGAKTMAAGGVIGLALTLPGLLLYAALVLALSMLAPAIFSFTYYKQLERRGEL
jgi:uncharacterized membrane protein